MAILVIADHDNARLRPATLNAITAATRIGSGIDVLIAGSGCAAVAAAAARVAGIRRVLQCDGASCAAQLPENLAPMIRDLASGYTHLLAAATSVGKNLLPRVAALLGVAQISDIVGVLSADTFQRPIYAGNVIATVQTSDPIKVITVRATAFEAAPTGERAAPIEAIAAPADSGLAEWVGEELSRSHRPELAAAEIVIAGGRGVGSKEGFALIETVADRLGAAIGASRAAVDAGFVPSDCQVGQTGAIVAPRLYIAAGISGAIQHLAGMKDSRVIVAINKDPEAPIFEVADYGVAGDLHKVLPELLTALNRQG